MVFDDHDDHGGGFGVTRGRADKQLFEMTRCDEYLYSIPR